jgi:BirA family biotin operon repressor/biotin-[acetyl-CoA-carboxylase] ligase
MVVNSFPLLNSTNIKAKELAREGADPWTVILAEEQAGGYGKEKRQWFSPKGGLYFSVILPKSDIKDIQILTVLAAFSVARILNEEYKVQALIKPPNDIWVNNKKIAGILTENIIAGEKAQSSVIGIGINTNIKNFPKDLANIAASLKIETGQESDNKDLMKKITEELKKQLEAISQ